VQAENQVPQGKPIAFRQDLLKRQHFRARNSLVDDLQDGLWRIAVAPVTVLQRRSLAPVKSGTVAAEADLVVNLPGADQVGAQIEGMVLNMNFIRISVKAAVF
jgi:hypothetical protein